MTPKELTDFLSTAEEPAVTSFLRRHLTDLSLHPAYPILTHLLTTSSAAARVALLSPTSDPHVRSHAAGAVQAFDSVLSFLSDHISSTPLTLDEPPPSTPTSPPIFSVL